MMTYELARQAIYTRLNDAWTVDYPSVPIQWENRLRIDLFQQTAPARQNILDRGNTFLGIGGQQQGQQGGQPQGFQLPTGEWINLPGLAGPQQISPQGGTDPFRVDPSASPLYAPGKFALERQFQGAEEGILSSLPQGGALLESLANAQIGKAGALAGLEADISQDFFNKIYGLATGAPQQSIGGLGGASSVMGGLAGQQAQAAAIENAGKNDAAGNLGAAFATAAFAT